MCNMYRVSFHLPSSSQFRKDGQAMRVPDVEEAIELLDQLNTEGDVIYIFLDEPEARVKINLKGRKLYFEVYMVNGLYVTISDKPKIIALLKNLQEVCNRPKDYNLDPRSI